MDGAVKLCMSVCTLNQNRGSVVYSFALTAPFFHHKTTNSALNQNKQQRLKSLCQSGAGPRGPGPRTDLRQTERNGGSGWGGRGGVWEWG